MDISTCWSLSLECSHFEQIHLEFFFNAVWLNIVRWQRDSLDVDGFVRDMVFVLIYIYRDEYICVHVLCASKKNWNRIYHFNNWANLNHLSYREVHCPFFKALHYSHRNLKVSLEAIWWDVCKSWSTSGCNYEVYTELVTSLYGRGSKICFWKSNFYTWWKLNKK